MQQEEDIRKKGLAIKKKFLYSLVSGGGGPGLPPVSYFDAISDTQDTQAIVVLFEDFMCQLYCRTEKKILL